MMPVAVPVEKSAFDRKISAMPSVLIVDDEPLIRWSVAESLEEAGYPSLEAASAREAIEMLEAAGDCIDAIVLDLKLPDSSDLGLLRRICASRPDCRVILITAHGTPEIMEEALRAGAHGVLLKPFDMSRIVALVASH